MVVLGGGAVSYERDNPVGSTPRNACEPWSDKACYRGKSLVSNTVNPDVIPLGRRLVAEEAPASYKDVSAVVRERERERERESVCVCERERERESA